ncbi:hypothetical protein AXF42_Ash011493 [Apostasia shenzhenica]|uniref:DUF8040 domain-containing protein n=1 Tax=Apostasia shenzhenica TaxID=1088818 RepID=A0A2I0BAU3_9ASPA|nr:hypothetical protein AXF42_Ash011493 [Apostasia shenzhenica]
MYNRSYSGHEYVNDLLVGHPGRFQSTFRMSAETFTRLRDFMVSRDLIKDTRNMTATEQVTIFFRVITHSASARDTAEFLQHSLETVSRYFKTLLNAIFSVVDEFVKLPNENTTSSIANFKV